MFSENTETKFKIKTLKTERHCYVLRNLYECTMCYTDFLFPFSFFSRSLISLFFFGWFVFHFIIFLLQLILCLSLSRPHALFMHIFQ